MRTTGHYCAPKSCDIFLPSSVQHFAIIIASPILATGGTVFQKIGLRRIRRLLEDLTFFANPGDVILTA